MRKAALEAIIGSVSRETLERLAEYEKLFLHWNRSINIAAPSTLDDFWERHILDGAQLFPLAGRWINWIDLGSGGGVPGLVMAILAGPGSVTLVESNRKKAAFLRLCGTRLGLDIDVWDQRIEEVKKKPVDVVSARALMPLPGLLVLAQGWLAQGSRGLFHKGRNFREEVQQARDQWAFDLIEHVSAIDPESRILEVSNLRQLER